jgi:hypothetical protein
LKNVTKSGDEQPDPTCHPDGKWAFNPSASARSDRAQKYEEQITKMPAAIDYRVGNVWYDGCAAWDPRKQLLEAKGEGMAQVLAIPGSKAQKEAEIILQRQSDAANGRPVDWHVAEKVAADFYVSKSMGLPNVSVIHTPAIHNSRN